MISRTRAPASRTSRHRLVVALAIEHHHHHVADVDPLALGDQLERLRQRPVEVEQVGDLRAAGDLLHVDDRARDRTSSPRSASAITAIAFGIPSAVSRVPSSGSTATSTCGGRAVADLLAVVEHRGLVLLPLPDHHDAVHRDRVEHVAHRVDGGLVGTLLVAAADHPRRRERGRLGHPHELERQVAVGPGGVAAHARVAGAHRTPGGYAAEPTPARATPRRRPSAGPPPARRTSPRSRRSRRAGYPGLSIRPRNSIRTTAITADHGGHLAARPGQSGVRGR